MKRLAIAACVGAILVLTGCTAASTFSAECLDAGGVVMEDSKTTTLTTVNTSGGVGFGATKVTIALCVVDGDVVDMEVK